MPRHTIRVLVAVLLLALAPSQRASSAAPPAGLEPQLDGAFGYWVGEERHYVLGPPEALAQGEMATWLIRLESVSGDGENRQATFGFAHIREMASQGMIDPEAGEILGATVEGTAKVNMHGFPLELSFTLRERYYGYGEEAFTLRYVYEDDQYEKEVWYEGDKADYLLVLSTLFTGHLESGDRRPPADASVGSMVIVVVEPGL